MSRPDLPLHYTLPVSRDDWPDLLADWQPIIPPNSTPWLLTKFGEIFFIQPDQKIGMLQVSSFQYEVVAKNQTDFQEWLVDPDKLSEWFLAPLVDSMEAQGKKLEGDRCYSFITPLGLGGELKPENVMAIPVCEHFKCWGEVFRQIKDLPEGAQITLKPS
jgi:hypothetical protein